MTLPTDPLRRAPSRAEAEGLSETVAALREEIRGLRASARLRAVIEQAKGILVERHGITLDEAFDRLRRMSQQHNVRLVEVAATIVGITLPPSTAGELDVPEEVLRGALPASPSASRTWSELQRQPDVRAGLVSALVSSVAGATSAGDEAAGLLHDLLRGEDVSAVTIYRAAPDQSLRLVGQVGVPGDVISSWRSIPPTTDIPYVRSVLENRPIYWGTREERRREYPGISTSSSDFQAAAALPVVDGDMVVGTVGLMWDGVEDLTPQRVARLAATVQRVTPLLLGNVTSADPELEWLNTLLQLHLDPWLLFEAIPGADGVVRDFVLQATAPGLPGSQDWLGRRLLELWPSLARDGTAEALAGLARAGGSWTTSLAHSSDAPWGRPGARLRAVRLGRRVVLVWRPPTAG